MNFYNTSRGGGKVIVFKHTGDFKRTKRFFDRAPKVNHRQILDMYGREGVRALSAATPVDTGLTASSWNYEVRIFRGRSLVRWTNSHVNKGIPIAILIQYGHATRQGGVVQGRDFINPALRSIFDKLANAAWEEVKAL